MDLPSSGGGAVSPDFASPTLQFLHPASLPRTAHLQHYRVVRMSCQGGFQRSAPPRFTTEAGAGRQAPSLGPPGTSRRKKE